MSILEPCVSQFSLTIDAAETITLMVESADTPWGRRLNDALIMAMGTGDTFAVSPYGTVTHADFAPGSLIDSAKVVEVGDRSVCGVLSSLEKAGLVTTRTVLHEDSHETYLSEGRIITSVHVERAFVLVSVDYRWSTRARYSSSWDTYADLWEITDRSYIVPEGWYLVGEVGEYVYDLAGVAGAVRDSDDCFYWLYDLEGFSASHCMAECDQCGSRWTAESGSWHFEADWSDACSWSFDDAWDFDESANTVGCPQCGTGRVAFMIS
nr:hypothetical protein [Kibdelosporangium sp. MJ126-NF4]CEL17643.1 hypothetical protein [Kibdelosporangium sp. MJ126-NF4]